MARAPAGSEPIGAWHLVGGQWMRPYLHSSGQVINGVLHAGSWTSIRYGPQIRSERSAR